MLRSTWGAQTDCSVHWLMQPHPGFLNIQKRSHDVMLPAPELAQIDAAGHRSPAAAGSSRREDVPNGPPFDLNFIQSGSIAGRKMRCLLLQHQ